jgi:hypothetical protein
MKIIITENQSDKINHRIKSTVEKFGLENALKIFGGNKNIIRKAYEDDPLSFLDQFNNLKPVINDDKIYYVDENKLPLFVYYQDKKYGKCIINYYRIWSFFEDIFRFNYLKSQQLIKEWLEETYNLGGLTPVQSISVLIDYGWNEPVI